MPKKQLTKFPETPMDNRIIILEDAPPTKTASGIFLPEQSQEKPFTGTIIAAGPMCTHLQVGDRVRYIGRMSRKEDMVTINGIEYLMARETDIYTKFN